MIFAEEVFSSGRRDSCLLLAAVAMRELCDNWQRGDKFAETKQGGTSGQSIFVQRGQVRRDKWAKCGCAGYFCPIVFCEKFRGLHEMA